jgi:hypothetical protein
MSWTLLLRKKNGKIAVEYIAIMVLALAVLLILILFSDKLREEMVKAFKNFFGDIIRRR